MAPKDVQTGQMWANLPSLDARSNIGTRPNYGGNFPDAWRTTLRQCWGNPLVSAVIGISKAAGMAAKFGQVRTTSIGPFLVKVNWPNWAKSYQDCEAQPVDNAVALIYFSCLRKLRSKLHPGEGGALGDEILKHVLKHVLGRANLWTDAPPQAIKQLSPEVIPNNGYATATKFG